MNIKKSKENFIRDGYIECPDLFDRKKCKDISKKLKKSFDLKKIFLTKKEYLNQHKKQKKKILLTN